jgi:porin
MRIGRASGLPPYESKIAVGGWYYTATFDALGQAASNGAADQHHGSGGGYVLGDVVLARSQTAQSRRLAGFVEAGLGDGRVDRFAAYLGTGLVATGPFSGRPADEAGFAVAIAHNGSAYLSQQRALAVISEKSETALEVTYLAQVASWLAIQPDVQYVIHPNTNPTLRNAFAVQLRFETMF